MRGSKHVPVTSFRLACGVLLGATLLPSDTGATAHARSPVFAVGGIANELAAAHGEAERPRIERGLRQAADLWRAADGDSAEFAAFAIEYFIPSAKRTLLDSTLARCELALEQIDGHAHEVGRELRRASEVDEGSPLPLDRLLTGYSAAAHVTEDLFTSKFAFVVLLNFPVTTLTERAQQGDRWSRKEWAAARLASRVAERIPPGVLRDLEIATNDAGDYVSRYNIWMHHLLDDQERRPFPPGMRLISHWNLRDEIKACYAKSDGLAKQRMIAAVMERIVTQTIPAAVIDNPRVDWNPVSNEVRAARNVEPDAPPLRAQGASLDSEPDTRYAKLLAIFHAERGVDRFTLDAPTAIDRHIDRSLDMPQARIEEMLHTIAGSPLVPRVARVIERRLGRTLEPFDIWYAGFAPLRALEEGRLDSIVAARYPTAASFHADIPRLLRDLGFSPERSAYLSERVVFEPSRGAGHAIPAVRRGDKPRLRARVGPGGMDYKGFDIAVHEMGHAVEQVFSLYNVDHMLLSGVPNNAITEALAFIFQARVPRLLGVSEAVDAEEPERALGAFWSAYEICGPALVELGVWRWMYDHPGATPAEVRQEVIRIAREVWNRYYERVLGGHHTVLLGIYSHMLTPALYLANYPIGRIVAFQIEDSIRRAHAAGVSIGLEFERMATCGSISPDLWMRNATGAPLSPEPLLQATERALSILRSP